MGNCMKSTDPLTASLPKSISIDTTAIKESGVPIIFVIGGPGAGKSYRIYLYLVSCNYHIT